MKLRKGAEEIEFILVTNTIYPYLLHNISILSLPYGITYHFRYQKTYLGSTDLSALQGKLGLLVLRDWDGGTFIPLRTFRFFRVENFGQHIFFDLEFLDYVQYDVPADLKADQLQDKRETYHPVVASIFASNGIANEPGKEISSVLIEDKLESIKQVSISSSANLADRAQAWSNIVTLLGGIDYYSNSCFYLIASLREIGSEKNAQMFQSEQQKGFKLYANRTYQMQILQILPSGKPPTPPGFEIKLLHISDHVLPLRTSKLVDGPYDRLEFPIYVLPQSMRRVNSFLIVENSQPLSNPRDKKNGPDVTEEAQLIGATNGVIEVLGMFAQLLIPKNDNLSRIPSSRLPVKIKWSKIEFLRKRILPAPLGIVAVILYFFAIPISQWIGTRLNLGQSVKPEFVQLLAFIILAASAGNWATFTGAFKAQPGPKP